MGNICSECRISVRRERYDESNDSRISVRGERGVGNVVNVDKCEERECGEYM